MNETIESRSRYIGFVLLGIGIAIASVWITSWITEIITTPGGEITVPPVLVLAFSAVFVLVAIVMLGGLVDIGIDVFKGRLNLRKSNTADRYEGGEDQPNFVPPDIAASPKTIPDEELERRRAFASNLQLPDQLLSNMPPKVSGFDWKFRPSGDAFIPTYHLDSSFRIIDWNEAFSLAFDATMEGRRGQGIAEWINVLDNYEQCLEHGMKNFSNKHFSEYPMLDLEPVKFTSNRYGRLEAKKRAFWIPDDGSNYAGWVCTLELSFQDDEKGSNFRNDLVRRLSTELIWSEYAMTYDRVLMNTEVYPELLDHMLGIRGDLQPIRPDTNVMDLGAGTGNLTIKLSEENKGRTVYAIDNNRTMLDILKWKCRPYIRDDANGPGVFPLKQNIHVLNGIGSEIIDCAFLTNVLYIVEDVEHCLREVYRVLRKDGEIRMTGPRKDTDLSVLFERIKGDLEKAGRYSQLREDFEHVKWINRQRLANSLYRWTTSEAVKLLQDAGFRNVRSVTEDLYEGQSMLIAGVK